MAKETTKKDRVTLNIKGMKLSNVRRLSDKVVAFSLNGNGLGLYNLKVIEGKNGKFIATPQEKAKNGEYYNIYSVYFSEEDEAKIIKAVLDKVPEKKEEENEDVPF